MGRRLSVYIEVYDTDTNRWKLAPSLPSDRSLIVFNNSLLSNFLVDISDDDLCPSISDPKGIPHDVSSFVEWEYKAESLPFWESWTTLGELLAFDYDQFFWDRRIEIKIGNVQTTGFAEHPNEGSIVTVREYLGSGIMTAIEALKVHSNNSDKVRLISWFTR